MPLALFAAVLVFESPAWLVALAVLAPLPWWIERVRPRVPWPFPETPRPPAGSPRSRADRRARLAGALRPALRTIALAGLTLALARPGCVTEPAPTSIPDESGVPLETFGVGLVLAIDRSASMGVRDYEPLDDPAPPRRSPIGVPSGSEPVVADSRVSRLEAAVEVARRFVERRGGDRIGLVVFADAPDALVPPTLDHRRLRAALGAVRPARAAEGGTRIGDAIAFAVDQARALSNRSRVVALITDGLENPGGAGSTSVAPERAAELAAALGVRLHAIALGRPDASDREALADWTARAGGRVFEADTTAALEEAFRALDRLERDRLAERIAADPEPPPEPRGWAVVPLAVAVLALAAERLLPLSRVRPIP